MSGIIPGYNYDIFISYRQKDNKGDRWVSEFVGALKTELESTFKEEISVYFDINPHDGLLETHDVDASLKDKLKCLVFIPIISRTYCDPKSFAWEYEFKAFIDLASKDQFGLKIKLPSGNVASRVLPVRIHDLDAEDIKECESVMGSILRGVEFIYKEPGVDRPLTTKDNEEKNLNKTSYRNQINKAALAIREVIQGMKAAPVADVKEKIPQGEALENVPKERKEEIQKKLTGKKWFRWLSALLITTVVAVAAIFTYPKVFNPDRLEKLRSSDEKFSIAVMPFQNLTNDTIWDVWQEGIQNELITTLTNSEELRVRQTESINTLLQGKGLMNQASITPTVAGNISQKLNAGVFIIGSIKEAGTTIRINAQLVDSKTRDALKSFQIDGKAENILYMADSLSGMVCNFLIIDKLGKVVRKDMKFYGSSNSTEAYINFIYGQKAFFNRDYSTAIPFLEQAARIDTNFMGAAFVLAFAYDFIGRTDLAKRVVSRSHLKRDQVISPTLKLALDYQNAWFFETPAEQIKYLKLSLQIDEQVPFVYYDLAVAYHLLKQYDKAIPEYEKALEIYAKWDIKPPWIYNYTDLGDCYHATGQYRKEKELYRKAENDFPGDPVLIRHQAVLPLTEGDTVAGYNYIRSYISQSEKRSVSEASIANNIALTYYEAGITDKAEKYYRQALALEPENPARMNSLAWFLIDTERNVAEGLEIIDEALTLSPDNWYMLDTKGWGLYKQGRYEEALKLIERSWELKDIYDHDLFLHREAVKKAVAGH